MTSQASLETSFVSGGFAFDWPESELMSTEYDGVAYTKVPPGYSGRARVQLNGRHHDLLCFPSVEEANSAACMAVGVLGGYTKAIVLQAPETAQVTHETAQDWFFS